MRGVVEGAFEEVCGKTRDACDRALKRLVHDKCRINIRQVYTKYRKLLEKYGMKLKCVRSYVHLEFIRQIHTLFVSKCNRAHVTIQSNYYLEVFANREEEK